MSLTLLATSKNGRKVYFDTEESHAATHFADTPMLKELVKEIVSSKELNEQRMLFDSNMGRIVGVTDLVANRPGDIIVYAKRKNRGDVFTSFNKSQKAAPCSIVAVGVERQSDGTYELLSAWIGSVDSPPFPGDNNETAESKPYWMSHSLVWGAQEIQPGSETSTCPW